MNIEIERTNMIKQQLRTGDVFNEQILSLFNEMPRHLFVPSHLQHFAYSDMQIELPHFQKMMTPLEEALLLQAINLSGTETVLEVGTGSGFLTALLSRLSKKVTSIEYFKDLTDHAQTRLSQCECNNVELVTGDASHGSYHQAPVDVMIMTAAIEKITDTHRLQILPGGRLFAIVGKQPIMQGQLHQLSPEGKWSFDVVFETCLPSLIENTKPSDFVF